MGRGAGAPPRGSDPGAGRGRGAARREAGAGQKLAGLPQPGRSAGQAPSAAGRPDPGPRAGYIVLAPFNNSKRRELRSVAAGRQEPAPGRGREKLSLTTPGPPFSSSPHPRDDPALSMGGGAERKPGESWGWEVEGLLRNSNSDFFLSSSFLAILEEFGIKREWILIFNFLKILERGGSFTFLSVLLREVIIFINGSSS